MKLSENKKQTSHYHGHVDDMIRFVEKAQLLDRSLWKRFVDQFRAKDADWDGGWRGEYWGKMMRGACLTYQYTRNPELYEILTETVKDMLSAQRPDGRISSYGISHERTHWDLWCRKYVILGMEYFIEICDDQELIRQLIDSMCRQVDAIMDKIGDGKQRITEASNMYRGLNSSSILEPVVKLYRLTGKKEYLNFAEHIISCGGTSVANVFQLAYEDQLYPYQYPFTKAYELMSCFEGLMEYYEVTGTKWCREAVIRFADKLLESDATIIGSLGCTHEFLDHAANTQSDSTNQPLMQETCVTVTWMKFLYRMTLLTGDMKYVDAFERAMYNAYFGAINTNMELCSMVKEEHPEAILEPLPFDSYSPLTKGSRGKGVGGFMVMADRHHYGCCACIGSAGNGLIPKIAVLQAKDGIALNLFIPGKISTETPAGRHLLLDVKTAYPSEGKVRFSLTLDEEERFHVYLRNPEWSVGTKVQVNGESIAVEKSEIDLNRVWKNGDIIEMELDMRVKTVFPVLYGHDILMNKMIWNQDYMVSTYRKQDEKAADRRAFVRGPITLALDASLGWNPDCPTPIAVGAEGIVEAFSTDEEALCPYPHVVALKLPLEGEDSVTAVDYGSAGKTWREDLPIAAWVTVR